MRHIVVIFPLPRFARPETCYQDQHLAMFRIGTRLKLLYEKLFLFLKSGSIIMICLAFRQLGTLKSSLKINARAARGKQKYREVPYIIRALIPS